MKAKELFLVCSVFVLTFLISVVVIHNIKTQNSENFYYTVLEKSGAQGLSEKEFDYVKRLIESENPQDIRNGLGIYMLIKDKVQLAALEEKVFSLVYHSDDELRATALMSLSKTKSRLFNLGYETIQDGELVYEAKRLINIKNPFKK